MKSIYIFIASLFLPMLISSCFQQHENLDPQGNPSGGVIEVEVLEYDSNQADIRVRLFAVDHFGEFMDGLIGTDFEIIHPFFNYEVVNTCIELGEEAQEEPYSAMMLFDQSGSITGTDPDDARIIAGVEFTKVMSGKDEGAVAAFASDNPAYPNDLEILESFTGNRSRLRNRIRSLKNKTEGNTPLYQSIYEIIPEVGNEASNDQKALIVFTDGEDTEGGISIQQIIDVAQEEGVEVYTVGLSLSVNEQVLTSIAHNTGGAIMFAEDALQLISLYNSLAEVLRGSYQFYDLCFSVTLDNGEWFSGDTISFNLVLELPGGEIIVFPVYAVL